MNATPAIQPIATVAATHARATSAANGASAGAPAKSTQPHEMPNATDHLQRMHLDVHVDRDTNEIVMRIRDPASGTVIYQMPSAVALDIAKHIEAQGKHLVDEKA